MEPGLDSAEIKSWTIPPQLGKQDSLGTPPGKDMGVFCTVLHTADECIGVCKRTELSHGWLQHRDRSRNYEEGSESQGCGRERVVPMLQRLPVFGTRPVEYGMGEVGGCI